MAVEQGRDRFRVTGGRRLTGTVRISGAKNAVLPILAATVLCPEEVVIRGVPAIRDVQVMLAILRRLGVRVREEAGPDGITLVLDPSGLATAEVHEELTREMRSSIFLMGPLLGRVGWVRMAYPGGCAIGPRPIDLHLRGLQELGAHLEEKSGYIEATAPRLRGREIYLDFPSVGATENLMMAAVLAEGTTVIRGAAREPEIVDLQSFLCAMGARVRGAGLDVIRIEGVQRLHGAEHTVAPDRIEAGSFMAAVAAAGGDVKLENVIAEHVEAPAAKLREMGVWVEEEADGSLRVRSRGVLQASDLKTLPYPGFPTDLQPQFMAVAAAATGTSVITETIFENRFRVAEELRRMGAQIKVEGRTAVVKGVPRLSGAPVTAPALREGMALIIAGLAADGVTEVFGADHVDRGYERLDEKLRGLGAEIVRL
nr:MAG: UDP-N-acetylglucosamine 1-carboxyvinyltransferase [Bacillota bacterium]